IPRFVLGRLRCTAEVDRSVPDSDLCTAASHVYGLANCRDRNRGDCITQLGIRVPNRSAIEFLCHCANGRKETDGCKAGEKWRTALEATSVVSIDADVNWWWVRLQKRSLEARGGAG